MPDSDSHFDSDIHGLSVVVAVRDLAAELDFFVERAGFRIDAVIPADDPATANVSRDGLSVRLERADADVPTRLRATGPAPARLRSPGGTVLDVEPPADAVVVPAAVPSVVVTRPAASWVAGRAGMRYRDLLPDRWGGRFIASHIHIPVGGPVPDYVHYHRIRFQLIVVKAGWVEVVYEDQGEPFVLDAGDAVLQPPEIRHRVLRSSDDLEVIEVGCPADHVTLADHDVDLPTASVRPERRFDGQRFARSTLAATPAGPGPFDGYRSFATGFGEATAGIVDAAIVEPVDTAIDGSATDAGFTTEAELSLLVVLQGRVTVAVDARPEAPLDAGGSVALPTGTHLDLHTPSPDLRLLVVTSP